MEWVYLFPHFDDVAFSCGGLVWEQGKAGKTVAIWTICGGKIPAGDLSPFAESLHQRWETGREAVALRQQEDQGACKILGASYRYFDIPDAIYRRSLLGAKFLYPDEVALFDNIKSDDYNLAASLAKRFSQILTKDVQLVCPLSLGNHVDHQLTRLATQQTGNPLVYYADYPYVLDENEQLVKLENVGWQKTVYPLNEDGLKAWMEAISAYRSQISTFWRNLDEMKSELERYLNQFGGICLWQEPIP